MSLKVKMSVRVKVSVKDDGVDEAEWTFVARSLST